MMSTSQKWRVRLFLFEFCRNTKGGESLARDWKAVTRMKMSLEDTVPEDTMEAICLQLGR